MYTNTNIHITTTNEVKAEAVVFKERKERHIGESGEKKNEVILL